MSGASRATKRRFRGACHSAHSPAPTSRGRSGSERRHLGSSGTTIALGARRRENVG